MTEYSYTNLVLYSYGKCNLNCRYCTIDKNPSLNDLDKLLEDSFINYETDYVPRIEKYFPNNTLTQVETWGGEPLARIERIFPLLNYIINHQSNFKTFFSSTNFSYTWWFDEIKALIDFFSEYSGRTFEIKIQLSCDGPEYINDRNRGKGVTKRCLDNISKLCNYLKNTKLSSNLHLLFAVKPTLTMDDLRNTFQNKDKIIEYYRFFEDSIISKIEETQQNNPNIVYQMTWPNLAVPSEVTKEDGILFTNTCRLCTEINKECEKYFNYYCETKPFTTNQADQKQSWSYTMSIENRMCRTCGTGVYSLHLLPQNLYTTCYMSYVDLVDSYKTYRATHGNDKVVQLGDLSVSNHIMSVLTEEQLEKFHSHSKVMCENRDLSVARFNLTSIVALANADQIDRKYLNKLEALKALQYMKILEVHCLHAGEAVCSTMTLQPIDMFKLMLNGAIEYYEK